MIVSVIVATSLNNVIGLNNSLPWHLPKDLAYFKKITTGSVIIMGRKTYESIGKALPNRLNIVVTRDSSYDALDAEVCNDIESAISLAKDFLKNNTEKKEVFIIGGANIFKQTIATADKLYLNIVKANFDGDTFMPEINWDDWQLEMQEDNKKDSKNAFDISFLVYTKINKST